MNDVIPSLVDWLRRDKRVAVATIVEVERKAPREAGAAMVVSEDTEIAGSLSGGCVEGAVVETALEAIASGTGRLVTFGISDDQALGVGLACGGTIHVVVAPARPSALWAELEGAIAEGCAVALVTGIGGVAEMGARRLAFADEGKAPVGSIAPGLDAELDRVARAALREGRNERRTIGAVEVFVQSFAPPPVLHVVGAVHPAPALVAAAKALGYRVVVCDPRSPFATPERLPGADEIAGRWPDEHLAGARLGPRDAVVVLTHDLKFDVPALAVALRSAAGYVGAMGSRKTNERRLAALREAGVDDAALARLRAPVGLDIGARTPEEIAVSIVAELIATRAR